MTITAPKKVNHDFSQDLVIEIALHLKNLDNSPLTFIVEVIDSDTKLEDKEKLSEPFYH